MLQKRLVKKQVLVEFLQENDPELIDEIVDIYIKYAKDVYFVYFNSYLTLISKRLV